MRSSSTAPSVVPRRVSAHPADEEPATVRRRVLRSESPASQAQTMRLPRVDPKLLALARGESEGIATLAPPQPADAYDEPDPTTVRCPDSEPPPATLGCLELVPQSESHVEEPVDPFGGLIPVEDEEEGAEGSDGQEGGQSAVHGVSSPAL